MKKISVLIALGMLMIAPWGMAQTIYDGAKLTGKDLNGTARFVGMGGAMGALGGDISTMGTPAGIGLYRSSDVMTSFGFSLYGNESQYLGKKFNSDLTKGDFNNIGFVFSSKIGNETPLRFVNFGFNYHKAKSFNNNMRMEGKDWNEEWEKNFFQPIIIGNRCVIHSTFHQDIPKAEYDIVINPQMAFGTGHHETTSLIIEELLDSELKDKSLLDMGCGTSILAILARMRGARPCTAIDIDEWCVRNSIENIELNHVDDIAVSQGDASSLTGKGPFDVIIANINRNILLNDMKQYVASMHTDSELYMSGFYVDDITAIREEAEKNGLTFVHYKEKNRWAEVKFVYKG